MVGVMYRYTPTESVTRANQYESLKSSSVWNMSLRGSTVDVAMAAPSVTADLEVKVRPSLPPESRVQTRFPTSHTTFRSSGASSSFSSLLRTELWAHKPPSSSSVLTGDRNLLHFEPFSSSLVSLGLLLEDGGALDGNGGGLAVSVLAPGRRGLGDLRWGFKPGETVSGSSGATVLRCETWWIRRVWGDDLKAQSRFCWKHNRFKKRNHVYMLQFYNRLPEIKVPSSSDEFLNRHDNVERCPHDMQLLESFSFFSCTYTHTHTHVILNMINNPSTYGILWLLLSYNNNQTCRNVTICPTFFYSPTVLRFI